MFLKMNLFIILCFFFASITYYDWCLLIAPDGNYRELGITRHWETTDENSDEFVMYNKGGDEWLFDIISGTDYSPQNMSVQINEWSKREVVPKPDLIIRYFIRILTNLQIFQTTFLIKMSTRVILSLFISVLKTINAQNVVNPIMV